MLMRRAPSPLPHRTLIDLRGTAQRATPAFLHDQDTLDAEAVLQPMAKVAPISVG